MPEPRPQLCLPSPQVSLQEHIETRLNLEAKALEERFRLLQVAIDKYEADMRQRGRDANEWRSTLETVINTMLPKASYEREHTVLSNRLNDIKDAFEKRLNDTNTRVSEIAIMVERLNGERKGSNSTIATIVSVASFLVSIVVALLMIHK